MKKWFVVLAIATSIAGICLAQTKPVAKKEQPGKQRQKAPQFVKFSMSILERDRVDPSYASIPVSMVVNAIEKMTNTEKGEFESTADYDARKAAALTTQFLGDSTVGDAFAFVLPVAAGPRFSDGMKYSFDADTSEVRVYVLPKPSSMNGIRRSSPKSWRKSSGLDQFDLDNKVDSTETYQASNAYGAEVTVEKTVSTRLGIAANEIPFVTHKRVKNYPNPIPSVQFNMENSKAARELPALKTLVVMKLADEPYVVYDRMRVEPTRDSPTEEIIWSKYLTGNVLGIVFYSGLTGEIFARLPESFGKPASKVEGR